MHFYTWRSGLKTGLYYLRTRPAAAPIQYTVPFMSPREPTSEGSTSSSSATSSASSPSASLQDMAILTRDAGNNVQAGTVSPVDVGGVPAPHGVEDCLDPLDFLQVVEEPVGLFSPYCGHKGNEGGVGALDMSALAEEACATGATHEAPFCAGCGA